MKSAHKQVAREIADELDVFKGTPLGDKMAKWLLLLCPPRKSPRVRSKGVKASRATTKELDKLCREVVFLRDNHTCCMCGKPAVDWSHIYSRRYKWLRWSIDPPNSYASCKGCHLAFHHRPADGMAKVKEWLDQYGDAYQVLVRKASRPQKADPAKWKLYLLQEKKKLEAGTLNVPDLE